MSFLLEFLHSATCFFDNAQGVSKTIRNRYFRDSPRFKTRWRSSLASYGTHIMGMWIWENVGGKEQKDEEASAKSSHFFGRKNRHRGNSQVKHKEKQRRKKKKEKKKGRSPRTNSKKMYRFFLFLSNSCTKDKQSKGATLRNVFELRSVHVRVEEEKATVALCFGREREGLRQWQREVVLHQKSLRQRRGEQRRTQGARQSQACTRAGKAKK